MSQQQERNPAQSNLLPYRAPSYDNCDREYATTLLNPFNRLSPTLRREFNEFTQNLMVEPQINCYKLMDAINDFEKDNRSLIESDIDWGHFNCTAHNCKPHQPCCVM